MRPNVHAALPFALLFALLGGCDGSASAQNAAPAASAAAVAPAAPSAAMATGGEAAAKRLEVRRGRGSFLIDAPLEKIKGASEEAKGWIELDAADLTRSKGELALRLTALRTTTFGDEKKDAAQSGHARNWLEVGDESPAASKAAHEYARFRLQSLTTDTPALAAVPEREGKRTVRLKATGDVTVHGVSVPRTVPLVAEFEGPASAPTAVSVRSEGPFDVSLKKHDVKPRDTLGKFLDGALEKVGKKIDDRVQVSVEFRAERP
ncbi:MAG TPA: YceI family protein [Polyangiaceae bacterium]|nr:YceI family protein [Polyangiaceae bacterium]